MPAYRLYVLDGDGKRIRGAEWIAGDTDDEAIAFVRAKKLSDACEIWDRSRLVAAIPAHRQ